MTQLRTVVLLLIVVSAVLAAPLKHGNVLTVWSPKLPDSPGGICSSTGYVMEMNRQALPVQIIMLPEDCLLFADPYPGYITLARNGYSAVIPCCVDQTDSPNTIGFVEIYTNGTTSSMTTLEMPSNATNVHNMVKDGTNMWFSSRDLTNGFAATYYADLASSEVTALVQDDTFFVDIVGNQLLVSNLANMADGLFQIGTALPKTEGQTLTPLMNEENAVSWFVRTDKYTYYAQLAPEPALIRCHADSWAPLYSIPLSNKMLRFVVLYESDAMITIAGNLVDESDPRNYFTEVYVDDGEELVKLTSFDYDGASTYYKIGSLNPTFCENGVKDNDESDVDCGGASCAACDLGQLCAEWTDCTSGYCASNKTCVTPTCTDGVKNGDESDVDCGGPSCSVCGNGKKCVRDSDCSSNYCNQVEGFTCTVQPPVVPLTPGNMLALNVPKVPSDNRCSDQGFLFEMNQEGIRVQRLSLPNGCSLHVGVYVGYLTLARDGQSAVIPCCINPSKTPKTIAFTEIHFNGTFSPVKTLQIPSDSTSVANIVKDGNEIWFNGFGTEISQTFYADLTSNQVVPLIEEDVAFVDIIDNELIVSNWFGMDDGLFLIGSGVPKTANQSLTPLLNQSNAGNWFVRTDKYAYYTQSVPQYALIRCDPKTWKPLYGLGLNEEFINFVVFYNSDNDINIVGTAYAQPKDDAPARLFVQQFADNGVEIQNSFSVESTGANYYKIGSLTPTQISSTPNETPSSSAPVTVPVQAQQPPTGKVSSGEIMATSFMAIFAVLTAL